MHIHVSEEMPESTVKMDLGTQLKETKPINPVLPVLQPLPSHFLRHSQRECHLSSQRLWVQWVSDLCPDSTGISYFFFSVTKNLVLETAEERRAAWLQLWGRVHRVWGEVGEAWTAGRITSTTRKQRVTNAGVPLTFPFSYSLGPSPGATHI